MRIISDQSGVTVVSDEGDIIVVSSADITYASVREYVIDQNGRDIERLRELISGGKERVIALTTSAIAAVDGDTSENAEPYRLENGDPVEDVIFETAVRVSNEGGNTDALAAFLTRLERNPSAASRSQLFAWLKAEGFTLTTEGLIVGYKGVTDDFKSVSVGREPVTVTTTGGVSEVHTGRIPYPVGAEVTIPRNLVDDNRNAACSVGLHVGTFKYASSFAHRVIIVLVDPADVVSVPRDSSDQKMRVARLVVAAEYDGSKIQQSVITMTDPTAVKEYQDRDENKSAGSSVDAGNGGETDSSPDQASATKPDDAVSELAVDILAKIAVSPLSRRSLGKRFSKNRRKNLNAALELLEQRNSVVVDDNGLFRVK